MKRLDKFLSEAGAATRKECRALIGKGRITVNGIPANASDMKIDENSDRICMDGKTIRGFYLTVILLNKPAGYVTSTDDPRDPTVMELIPERFRNLGVSPAGRLDKETEGLLLLTNDGLLNHRITSPKYGTEKRYYAEHEGTAEESDVKAFAAGITLRDGMECLPAVLEPISAGKSYVTVHEGKYHQVRRMMASRGMTVRYLRREQEGFLTLDGLHRGEIRELREEEIAKLRDLLLMNEKNA